MTNLKTILANKFPKTEDRIEGRLVFLEQHGIIELDSPVLHKRTGLDFYKVKFFTGYRKFTVIDAVVGLSMDNELFLLTNPLFSDEYSNLTNRFEEIKAVNVDQSFISEVVSLYKETGANVTEIDNLNYQIWLGDNKWRILQFEVERTLKIKTIPNSSLLKAKKKWWQKLFTP